MKFSQAVEYLKAAVVFNMEEAERGRSDRFIIPMFQGDPGVGKTAIPKAVASELNLPFFQTIVAQYDAGEMAGLPFPADVEIHDEHDRVVGTKKKMMRLRPSYLPDPDDANERVGIYNLDELPQAFLANQNICSQLVNEWRIGEHRLSRGITICATGNKASNKAGTTTMPMHLRDRLNFFDIEPDSDEWLAWAAKANVNYRVRSFIRNNPNKLHEFVVGADAFPTPRSWEKVGITVELGLEQSVRSLAIQGAIGSGTGTLFEQWLRVEDKMPKLDDVIRDPENAPVFGNEQADVLYVLLSALADKTDPTNVGQVLKYIKRLPNQEFSTVWSKDATLRDRRLLDTKEFTLWKMREAPKNML